MRLNVSPGKAGSYLVWLGGRFLGSSRAGEHTFTAQHRWPVRRTPRYAPARLPRRRLAEDLTAPQR
ncbi:hypothetical protein ACFWMG_28870 [Streptomyces sp. NPDC127074]|uniref:hypothetical protein n=1 Tax=Streptomyces sp. NPDC127074 TaxID=3347130 RepID=UPI003646421E